MGKSFSERLGITAAKQIQFESTDMALRTGLWNVTVDYFSELSVDGGVAFDVDEKIGAQVWRNFLKFPADEYPEEYEEYSGVLRKWFFHNHRKWYDAYEYVEYLAGIRVGKTSSVERRIKRALTESLNSMLELEHSGYRFVGSHFAPVTNNEEISEIQKAMSVSISVLLPVTTHITNALALFSKKPSPDYRNSMKESISAVESLCKLISGMEQTLSPTLENVTKHLKLNTHLRDGFIQIYKYTSSEAGIRHGSSDSKVLEQEDARFLLIACSAIVNLIIEKARKANRLPE